MKKYLVLTAVILCVSLMLTSCGTNENPNSVTQTDNPSVSAPIEAETESQQLEKRVAKDNAQMQTDDPAIPTRVIENGTRINLHFGDTVLPGILNDCDTAKALIDMLPYTVHMNSYSHDFCGVMPDALPYNEEEVHYGWLNGDIDYAIDAPYFTILHSDEDISEQYGYQVNIGVLDCELSKIRELSGSYDVLIELAEPKANEASTIDAGADIISSAAGEKNEKEQTAMKMNVQIGAYTFTAALEDNDAVRELTEMMRQGSVTITMDDYAGFEKVGPLGRSLTTSNSQTTTTAGDIVLYNGNNIVMFYGSNSWSYTRIGKIDDLTNWKKALGSGSITAVFTLAE